MWLLKANFLFDFDPFWEVSLLYNNEFRKSSLISSFYVPFLSNLWKISRKWGNESQRETSTI